MNDNMRKWMEALRSGEYQQCQRRLAIVNVGYCCLGVACEVAIKAGVSIEVREANDSSYLHLKTYDEEVGCLPTTVRRWLGLAEQELYVPPELQHKIKSPQIPGASTSFITLNDVNGFSFAEIADCIEYTFDKEAYERKHSKVG